MAVAICLGLSIDCSSQSNDSTYITIHFLHGSKPKHKYKKSESKWFGGLLGGHAGIEFEPNKIIDFVPAGSVHLFSNCKKSNSVFSFHDTISFYQILGKTIKEVQRTSIKIKISKAQKQKLDSLIKVYRNETPYDYAFFGMRCGAAAADILAKIGVLKQRSFSRTYFKFFYPRRLRRLLEHRAKQNKYVVRKQKGCKSRRWERD